MALSLKERMDRTKRSQARSLAGERGPDPALVAVPAANEPVHDAPVAHLPRGLELATPFDRPGLLAEFEDLLPAMASHYGYSEADQAFIRGAVATENPVAYAELALCVRQWRLDVVTHNLSDKLPRGVAERAWVQFRVSVMGEPADETGAAYSSESLMRPVEGALAEVAEKRRASPRP